METSTNHIPLSAGKRIVVKVGSGVLTKDNRLNIEIINAITGQICALHDKGLQVILVSSGAMAAGVTKLGLPCRPSETPKRQAVAAIGQADLIKEWEKALEHCGRKVAQILLTRGDLCDRVRYLNARNTINTLLEWQVLPIINENDTVAVKSLQFGDNDNLGAMITLLLGADLMINLTDIGGLYDKDPRVHADAQLLREVRTMGKNIEAMAGKIAGPLGTGGMGSKITAARKLTSAGIPMIIASGLTPNILMNIFNNDYVGTYFVPKKEKRNSRKNWIGLTLKAKGKITIDAGAQKAVLSQGKSILPSGITRVEDFFNVGDPVEFLSEDKKPLGMGLVNYNASDILKIMGCKTSQIKERLGFRSYDEVIHRDNLVITADRD
ncbi:MAG: glutamate 5-kinase [Proteobacteria bacterium]|nr:glutamate 5-kinase [Desulfobacula sp.]MBU4130389.1 glutamate 5-kinase [Pseudomonadota bacterium]